jgi:hypothetical protein
MAKIFTVILVIAAICAGLFFAVQKGYIQNNHARKLVSNVLHGKPGLAVATVRINGILSVAEGQLILTTPSKNASFFIVGPKKQELLGAAKKRKPVYVLGEFMPQTYPQSIGKTIIKYSVNVSTYSEKYFMDTDKMPESVIESIRMKLMERKEFREATIKKLGLQDERIEVIHGKLSLVNAVYSNDPKEQYCLVITDKYGDSYLVYDKTGRLKPFSKYKAGTLLVAVGEISLPDASIKPLDKEQYIPFTAVNLYNEDLTEYQAGAEAVKAAVK